MFLSTKLRFSTTIIGALMIALITSFSAPTESEQNENTELGQMMDDLAAFFSADVDK